MITTNVSLGLTPSALVADLRGGNWSITPTLRNFHPTNWLILYTSVTYFI